MFEGSNSKSLMHETVIYWVLPPLTNSWIILLTWINTALNRTPNMDCYWVGAVPKLEACNGYMSDKSLGKACP